MKENVHFSATIATTPTIGLGFAPKIESDKWSTPQAVFDLLNEEFSFTLDPASTHENAKCKKHYTADEDGLGQSWVGERVFLNPPYGRTIGLWVQKAATGGAAIVVALLPSRTDTRYFHQYIYTNPKCEIRFLKGRLKFGDSRNSAPFPSMVCIFRI